MAGSAFKDARVVKMAERFVAVLVDSRTHSALMDRYGLSSTPTLVYADPDGEAAASTDDAQPADTVLADMESAFAFWAEQAKAAGGK